MANRAMYEAIRAMSYDSEEPPRRQGIQNLWDLPLSAALIKMRGSRRLRRHYDELADKKFILEERFDPEFLPPLITHRFPAWNKLAVDPLPDFDAQLVLEFYAALFVKAETHGDISSVRVRGYTVSFSDADIARYFDLPPPPAYGDLVYESMLGVDEPIRRNEILDAAHLLMTGHARDPESQLRFVDLRAPYRRLKRFVNTNLRPTRIGLEPSVSDEELIFMFAITRNGVTVNVAEYIRGEINGFGSRASCYEAIPFPRLVSELCIQAIGYQNCMADHFYVQDRVDCAQRWVFGDGFPAYRR